MCLVSIIVPVYNVECYIEKCINSLLIQSYKNIEILLIDDGSTDDSGNICDKYKKIDNRIRVFHRSNAGVSVTRNFGIGKAKGEWIFFVDSDDWVHPQTVELAMERITEDCDICFIGLEPTTGTCNEDEKVIQDIKLVNIEKQDFQNLQFRILNRDRDAICDRDLIKLSSPTKLYKKELIVENDIKFPQGVPNGEDGVFNLYAYEKANRAIALEVPLYFYRQRLDSVTKKYTPKVEEDFSKLHLEYNKFIKTQNKYEDFKDVMDERYIWSFSFCCILKYCHPDNKNSYLLRKKEFLNTLNIEYKESVERVSLKHFGLQKKILFWAIKKRWFALISLLCYLNNKK